MFPCHCFVQCGFKQVVLSQCPEISQQANISLHGEAVPGNLLLRLHLNFAFARFLLQSLRSPFLASPCHSILFFLLLLLLLIRHRGPQLLVLNIFLHHVLDSGNNAI